MWNRFDQLAKSILAALLRLVATVETAREISTPVDPRYGGHVLIADVWAEPNDLTTSYLEQLGVLGRMVGLGACLIEPFSQPPRLRDIRSCILKQYSLDHQQARKASRKKRPEPAFPRLWVISYGKPQTVIQEMNLETMDGWPHGFWQREDFDAFHVINVRELPKTAETMFLRLLGRGRTFSEAVRELFTEPQHAWARELLTPLLIAFRSEIPQDSLEEEDMEALRELDIVYQEWEKRVKGDERREVLLELLAQQFGEVPETVRQRIEQADSDDLKRWTGRVIRATAPEDIFNSE